MHSKYSTPKKSGKGQKWRQMKRKEAERKQRIRKEERERRKNKNAPKKVSGKIVAERFLQRRQIFAQRYGKAGPTLHASAWLLHNCVAHPLLGALPSALTVRFHDATADWLNASKSPRSPKPIIRGLAARKSWLIHNCIAHPMMGLAPLGLFFDLHEVTADEMPKGWV